MAVPQSAPVSVGQRENRPPPKPLFSPNCPGLTLRIQSSITISTSFTSLKPLNLTRAPILVPCPFTSCLPSKGQQWPPAACWAPKRESELLRQCPSGQWGQDREGRKHSKDLVSGPAPASPRPGSCGFDPTKEGAGFPPSPSQSGQGHQEEE